MKNICSKCRGLVAGSVNANGLCNQCQEIADHNDLRAQLAILTQERDKLRECLRDYEQTCHCIAGLLKEPPIRCVICTKALALLAPSGEAGNGDRPESRTDCKWGCDMKMKLDEIKTPEDIQKRFDQALLTNPMLRHIYQMCSAGELSLVQMLQMMAIFFDELHDEKFKQIYKELMNKTTFSFTLPTIPLPSA